MRTIFTLSLQVTLYTAGLALISHSKQTSSPRCMLFTTRFLQNLIRARGVTATLIFDVEIRFSILLSSDLITHFISRIYPSSRARSGYSVLVDLQDRQRLSSSQLGLYLHKKKQSIKAIREKKESVLMCSPASLCHYHYINISLCKSKFKTSRLLILSIQHLGVSKQSVIMS